ncbi:hypothetical protein GCM10010174_26180 [Kutzneria viridogrisea]|uniref:DUF2786 domain-containing protein n=1 Tax=Kutzneria viridogrisea TaxID=47990 RepID=A0ABR6BSF0_9PSEU|nr:hypothetical protein [Kutzneria viridogrisea]
MTTPEIDPAKLERLRNQITGMTALAQDPGATEGERAAAARSLEKLMARYHLTDAILTTRTGRSPTIEDVEARNYQVRPPYAKELAELLCEIAECFSTKPLLAPPGRWVGRGRVRTWHSYYSTGCAVKIYGQPADLDRVEQLWQILLPQALAATAALRIPRGEYIGVHRASFLVAYKAAVRKRLRDARDQAAHDSDLTPGADLVLLDRRALANQRVQQDHPETTQVTAYSNPAAHAAGWRAGQQADLGRDKLSESGRRQLH